ncbi:bifunctional RNase H/acid phosphatase [Streptomyces sp. Je 1-79]|uniref:bifunctional RNase H/acid phosphatase n=1 Tax=Streptomyces sp. Je 1-79 TaxID=2943847 RepID=UPI0021A31276|nr:bifunctional RNase H/acid phosphatase [Streptomyces sp. Je 1-79]MCT4352949.1 bifunctional RNase H/acid phosphatase [Streptomyces sp. Je 1-79]
MTAVREVVVEADGGSRGNPGPAGYGAVVLDPVTGETLAERAEYIGVATNNVAEYKGLVAGLKAARELFPDATVHVRMDSKLVVEQMSGRWKIKHPDMKPLAAEAARIFPARQVRYEWIPREKNKHADRLANEAMDAGKRGRQWEPSASTAALDASAARSASSPPSGPQPAEWDGPPGDATAGAARARAALAGTGTGTRPATATGAGGAGPDDGLFPADGTIAAQARASLAAAATAERESAASGDFEAEAGVRGHEPESASSASSASAVGARGWGAPDMGAPATFVLLRHGETALTPEKRFSGSGGTDPELSAAGLRQADAVAAALAARGTIQEIVSSPLKRCRQTAEAVAVRLGLDVRIEDGLRETDFGAWEGLTFAEVRERYAEDLDAWLASPKAAPTGGGESFATVARRVSATRDRLTAAYAGRTVLLVTHVTPVKTLVRLALGAPPESLFRMELSAASLSAVAYYADGNASVRLLNDTSHLR